MSSAKYLIQQKEEAYFREKYIKSLPKLPMDTSLEKALPKALKILDKEQCSKENTEKCNKDLIILIEPLLIGSNGHYVFLKDKNERDVVRKALEFFSKNKYFKMLKEYQYTINNILKLNIFWIRDISEWKCSSNNTYKQIKSLISHLFCKYEVPEFMFEVWTQNKSSLNEQHLEWFMQLSSGESARNLSKFPIQVTKKMAHEFINTPFPGYSIVDAIRRCQILGMGGNERLANSILMSRLRHQFTNNDFWTTVIQFFIDTPMFNYDEVGAIIDYINEKKYVPTRIVINNIATYRAEMPGFSMKGRNIENLLRDTHDWHKQLARTRRNTRNQKYEIDLTSKWERLYGETYNLIEGSNEKRKVWHIIELTNAAELHDEGKTMHHCVYSYLQSCKTGQCSIFSLRLFGQSLVTIEVRQGRAVQIRGPYNKKPSTKEIEIIEKWAHSRNIEISKYAFGNR